MDDVHIQKIDEKKWSISVWRERKKIWIHIDHFIQSKQTKKNPYIFFLSFTYIISGLKKVDFIDQKYKSILMM